MLVLEQFHWYRVIGASFPPWGILGVLAGCTATNGLRHIRLAANSCRFYNGVLHPPVILPSDLRNDQNDEFNRLVSLLSLSGHWKTSPLICQSV